MKIIFANTLMEIAHKTEADCDEVVSVLQQATDRVISPRYLRGGMGDGGACHPRDLIAMSWLADRLELSADLLGFVARAREEQSAWLAGLALAAQERTGLPIGVLGRAYKPGTDLVDGSPALLLAAQLGSALAWQWDPFVDADQPCPAQTGPCVVVVATRHELFGRGVRFVAGSVVLDPFGYVQDQPDVEVVRLGRKSCR